jgi:Periplasmic protease
MWAMRYGADLKTPSASIQGPKVMLINEMAGFRRRFAALDVQAFQAWAAGGQENLGRTGRHSGLPGAHGWWNHNRTQPGFLDGGRRFWHENVGVPPDVEVEITPADYAAGRDPQLEKAIELVMEMLKKNPPKKMQRPPYPIRVRK